MFQWLRSDEANRIADKARAKAWKDFKERCPNADLSKFSAQVSFDDKRQATSEVYLNRSDRVQTSVSGSDRRYWDDNTKKPLGIGGFPPELTLSLRSGPEGANRIGTEVPAVPFKENAVSCFHEEIKIFVTPYQYFNAKFRAIFTRTKVQRSSGAESERWLVGPNMSYRLQQLNFAVWCATTGCGRSREILDKVPEQIKSFLMFHIYFTVRVSQLFRVTQLSAR